jgi:hypothetical protein
MFLFLATACAAVDRAKAQDYVPLSADKELTAGIIGSRYLALRRGDSSPEFGVTTETRVAALRSELMHFSLLGPIG